MWRQLYRSSQRYNYYHPSRGLTTGLALSVLTSSALILNRSNIYADGSPLDPESDSVESSSKPSKLRSTPPISEPQLDESEIYAVPRLADLPVTVIQNQDPSDPLQEGQWSLRPRDSALGFSRCDSVSISSQYPNEDYVVGGSYPLPSSRWWSFFCIFDGNNGYDTSGWLSMHLYTAVIGSLADLYSRYHANEAPSPNPTKAFTEAPENGSHETIDIDSLTTAPLTGADPPPEAIDATIKETFTRLDDDIVHWAVERAFDSPSKLTATTLLAPAYCGSSALVAFYESDTRLLRVALAGISRAVLGRRAPVTETEGDAGAAPGGRRMYRYETHVLGTNSTLPPTPQQDNFPVVSKSYKLDLSLGPFGNGPLKWDRPTQERLYREYLGEPPHPSTSLKSKDSVSTAEPTITTVKVMPGDFMVLATSGLWDSLTSEEVVGLVGWWINENGVLPPDPRQDEDGLSSIQLSPRKDDKVVEFSRDELPVTLIPPASEDRTRLYKLWKTPKRFIQIDRDNVARHLARNALGGADRDLTAALLKMDRRNREDLSVQVVFFND